jgi:hypothetical protein
MNSPQAELPDNALTPPVQRCWARSPDGTRCQQPTQHEGAHDDGLREWQHTPAGVKVAEKRAHPPKPVPGAVVDSGEEQEANGYAEGTREAAAEVEQLRAALAHAADKLEQVRRELEQLNTKRLPQKEQAKVRELGAVLGAAAAAARAGKAPAATLGADAGDVEPPGPAHEEQEPCGAEHPVRREEACTLEAGHGGWHRSRRLEESARGDDRDDADWPDRDPAACNAKNPADGMFTCTLARGHEGQHHDMTTTRTGPRSWVASEAARPPKRTPKLSDGPAALVEVLRGELAIEHQHTDSAWQVGDVEEAAGGELLLAVEAAGGAVAHLECDNDGRELEGMLADAKVMAAGPEALAVLREMVRVWRGSAGVGRVPPEIERLWAGADLVLSRALTPRAA